MTYWSQQETEALIALDAEGSAYESIAAALTEAFGREFTRCAVAKKVSRLGLRTGKRPAGDNYQAWRAYTAEEDRQIMELYRAGETVANIARTMHRSASSCQSRIKRLRKWAQGDKGDGIKEAVIKALEGVDPFTVNADALAETLGYTKKSEVLAVRSYLGQLRRESQLTGEARQSFGAIHMSEAIKAYTKRAERMVAAGTDPSAAINMVYQETGVRVCLAA